MSDPPGVPAFREFSSTKHVDVLVSDWRAALPPELSAQDQEQRLYGQVWEAYLEGDYAFGVWCWFECDRLTNAFNGSVKEVTGVLGPGHYLGFSHRKAISEKVPLDRVYRPRKGDMSTPRPDAVVLASYQLMCVYAVRAAGGDAKSKALLEIAVGELEERRRADPFVKHYETFRRLLDRGAGTVASSPAVASPATVEPSAPRRRKA